MALKIRKYVETILKLQTPRIIQPEPMNAYILLYNSGREFMHHGVLTIISFVAKKKKNHNSVWKVNERQSQKQKKQK